MTDMSKDDFLAGLSGAEVNTVEEEKPLVQVDIVDDEQGKSPENELDEYDETHLIDDFKTKIGFTGEIQGTGLDALAFAANEQIKQYKAIAEDQRVKDFLDFLDTGGTKEQFIQMQPTNNYGGIALDEEDTQLTENVVQEALVVLRNFDDQDEIDEFIADLKDKGKLFEYAQKNLPKLQDFEKAQNKQRADQIRNQVAQEKQELDNYYGAINESFKGNKLIGIAPDSNWSEVQKLSVPDEKGKIGINDILDNLDVNQVSTVNYFVYCLNKGIPFSFKPSGKEGTKPKPVLAMLDKGSSAKNTPQTQGAFGRALQSKMNAN